MPRLHRPFLPAEIAFADPRPEDAEQQALGRREMGELVLAHLRAGARVTVKSGGYLNEAGTVRDVRTNCIGETTIVTTLDTGTLFYGPVEPVR